MPLSFRELQIQVFTLYGQARFSDALDVVTRALPKLPEQVSRLTFWQACFLCLLERPDDALAVLEAHRSKGVWWNPDRLEGDTDLKVLRDKPEFIALVESSRAQQELMRAATQPQLEVVENGSAAPSPLLLAFHMRGSTLAATLPYWLPASRSGMTVAVPQSSQLQGPNEYEWTDAERAEREALGAFRKVQAEHDIDSSRVVLGGASQGADLVVQLALSGYPIPARGFVAVAGGGRVETLEPLLRDAAQRSVRGVFIVGELDPARTRVEAVYEMLATAGLELHLEVVTGLGHDYPSDFGVRLEKSSTFVFSAV